MTANTYTVYFDSSGTPDQDAAVVVAGFIAEDRQWLEFDRNWADTLRLFGVSALHMREFAHSLGEYTTWKGDNDKRAGFLKSLISHLSLRARHSFVSSIIMADYRDIDSRYQLHEFSTPLALIGCTCVNKVRNWADKWGVDYASIGYVFEDGDKDKGDLARRMKEHHKINPTFRPKGDCIAFQAADLLAYEHLLANRRIYQVGSGVLGMEDLRLSLQALGLVPIFETTS
jgi:hypothetical protein